MNYTILAVILCIAYIRLLSTRFISLSCLANLNLIRKEVALQQTSGQVKVQQSLPNSKRRTSFRRYYMTDDYSEQCQVISISQVYFPKTEDDLRKQTRWRAALYTVTNLVDLCRKQDDR